MGLIDCAVTLAANTNQCCVTSQKSEDLIYTTQKLEITHGKFCLPFIFCTCTYHSNILKMFQWNKISKYNRYHLIIHMISLYRHFTASLPNCKENKSKSKHPKSTLYKSFCLNKVNSMLFSIQTHKNIYNIDVCV
jgi:hypothetical protein